MTNLDHLSALIRNRGLTRREFVRLAVAGGMTAVAANSIFSTNAKAEPKKGGTFRLGVIGANTGASHDPGTWGVDVITNIGLWGGVYNNLTEIGPDGELVNELAESIEATPDARVWTFKLRKGITFTNGKTLDADDVIASFNHHRGEDSSSAAKANVDPIAEIRKDGNDTVIFELNSGNADFPVLCTDYHLVIGAAKDGKVDWETPIGTGGYKMTSHERGVRMSLDRNPDYWRSDRAHFDNLEILGVNDNVARTNALLTGEIDAMNRADLKTLKLLEANPNIVIEEVTGTQHYTLPMLTDTAPFDDNNVRMALKLSIDRDELVRTVLRGHGTAGNDHPISPANRYYAADLPQRVYDPEEAKHYLKKAGLSELSVSLSVSEAAFGGAVDTAVLFKEHALKAGIDINVVREPADGYWSNVWLKKPFVASFWGGRPTEDWMFTLAYQGGGAWNETRWANERFDKLLLEARAELDTAKRAALYHEMQQIVRDDGGTIMPMYANYVDARSNKLGRGDTIASNIELDGWKCVERWWFA